MNRRDVLRLLGAGLSAVSGCLSTVGGSTTSIRPLPEKPQDLNKANVVEYVRRHVEVSESNKFIRKGATKVSIDCNAALAIHDDTGFYVITQCFGSVRFDDRDGHLSYSPFYFVDENDTIPIDGELIRDTELYRSRDDTENLQYGEGHYDMRGFEVFNFDDEEHDLTMAISYVETDPPESVFDRTLTLDRHEGRVANITIRKGRYRVTIKLDGPTRTYRWTVTEESNWDGIWIAITPNGELITCGTDGSNCATTYPIRTETPDGIRY